MPQGCLHDGSYHFSWNKFRLVFHWKMFSFTGMSHHWDVITYIWKTSRNSETHRLINWSRRLERISGAEMNWTEKTSKRVSEPIFFKNAQQKTPVFSCFLYISLHVTFFEFFFQHFYLYIQLTIFRSVTLTYYNKKLSKTFFELFSHSSTYSTRFCII